MNWGTNPELHPELNLTMYHRNLNETLKQQALEALASTPSRSVTEWLRRIVASLAPAAKPQVRQQCTHVCVQQ